MISDNTNKKPHFLLVAITGGIASGKSTVAEALKAPNIKLIDADILARKAVNENLEILKQIVDVFGLSILDQSGKLNRRRMAEIIFSDSSAKLRLEAIIHPEVQRLLEVELFNLPKTIKVVLYLIPLLVEAKVELTRFDLIVAVLTDPEITLERILARDQISKELALRKIHSQATNEQKMSVSDYIIYNNGTFEELHENIQNFSLFLKAYLEDRSL